MSERRKSTLHSYLQHGLKAARATLSDKTNMYSYLVAARGEEEGKRAASRPPDVGASLKKASPTVALTTASVPRTAPQTAGKPPLPQPGPELIPFPSSPVYEESSSAVSFFDKFDHLDKPAPSSLLKRPLPVEPVRRRRSGAPPVQPPSGNAAHPHPRRHHTAIATSRASLSLSRGGSSTPSAKRAKKSKRVIADLHFTATVHRSLASFLFIHELVHPPDVLNDGVDSLSRQDRLLSERLENHLREQGYSVLVDGQEGSDGRDANGGVDTVLEHKTPEREIAMDVDIDVSLGSPSSARPLSAGSAVEVEVVLMDVDECRPPSTPHPAPQAFHRRSLPLVPSAPPPPPPSSTALPSNPPGPAFPPRAASPPVVAPPSSLASPVLPALPHPRVYTISQLVATLHMRHADRASVKGARNPIVARAVQRPGRSRLAAAFTAEKGVGA